MAEWVPGGFSRTSNLRVHVALPVMVGGAVDAVVVFTDSETWAGNVHPAQALRAYRDMLNRIHAL